MIKNWPLCAFAGRPLKQVILRYLWAHERKPQHHRLPHIIHASPSAIYAAFLDPDAVATWLPPGDMRGIVHEFEGREGAAFSMSLVYPDEGTEMTGKTSERIDRFRGRIAKLIPDALVVWKTVFDSPDPAFAGNMTIRSVLEDTAEGTRVTMVTLDIPAGIHLKDNEEGCRQTLEQLAAFVEA